MSFEGGGRTEEKKEEKVEKEKEEKFVLCESIGHRPLRGRWPKTAFSHLPLTSHFLSSSLLLTLTFLSSSPNLRL